MTNKEIGELRRRMKPDRTNLTAVYGCYVASSGEVLSTFREPFGLMAEEDKEVESKTDRIKKSFSSATPVHKEKPDLVAECVWEILPDEDACCFDYGMIVCSLVAADV